jgi:DNA-3-methyladenine glycosylase I
MTGLVTGPDGLARCGWANSTPDYLAYHDDEWGRPVHGETALYERFTLEAFQSGLSWLTILRKREGFRQAFAQFDADRVARFGEADSARLMADAGIVRNRAKVAAAITNARAVVDLREKVQGGLDALVWSFASAAEPGAGPTGLGDVPATTPESVALAKALKRHGFVFVGPTTSYAAMQACGLVNDHLAGCHARNRDRPARSGRSRSGR